MAPFRSIPLQIRNGIQYVRELGFGSARALVCRGTDPASLISLPVSGLAQPFICRNTDVDIGMVRSAIGRRESFVPLANPRFIIDAGAHIGTTASVYAAAYPDALLFAIEPDDSNYQLLRGNLAGYPNTRPMKAALWGRNEAVRIVNPTALSYSFQVSPARTNDSSRVAGMSLSNLLEMAGHRHCDLLKIDIEGAEWELMNDTPADTWRAFGTIVMELHERLRAGIEQLARATFPTDLWRRSQQGEYIVLKQRS